ncbi:hypothetical protein MBLNU459_g6742t3 [Dothideomycetes sp. NU459]
MSGGIYRIDFPHRKVRDLEPQPAGQTWGLLAGSALGRGRRWLAGWDDDPFAVKDAPTNPRGIPYAPFVDRVEDYVTSRAEVEGTMKNFQEMISTALLRAAASKPPNPNRSYQINNGRKYQFMEVNTQRRAAGLKDKIPDIQKTLDTVRFLKTRKPDAEPLETLFELNDTLYAKAKVAPTEEVYLWLGANVMLSYPIPEAESLLESKLDAAKSGLVNCEEDLDFLREQITTLEVATARVYNWDVGQRRKEKAEGTGSRDHDGPDEPNG